MQGLIFLGVAFGQPSSVDVAALWLDVSVELLDGAVLPLPELSDREIARIAKGGVVARRMREVTGIDRAVGIGWMPHTQDEVWVALQDDKHDTLITDLNELQLVGTTPNHKILYQHAELPFPISDRHWVLHIGNNEALYASSGGRIWERTWVLDPRGEGALREVSGGVCVDEDAEWTPFNEGGWWLIAGDGGTLAVYQVRFDAGGFIPDEFVLQAAIAKMDEMMEHIDERADVVPEHYREGHEVLTRPGGEAVPFW